MICFRPHRTPIVPSVVLTALFLLLAGVPAFGQAASDSVFRDFEPAGEWQFELDGQVVEDAEIYLSKRAGAYLIMAPSLKSPLLINARTQSVERVSLLKVAKKSSGNIDLLADASFDRVGGFSVRENQVSFDVGGQSATVAPKPPLVGTQTASALVDYNASYGAKADKYEPSQGVLAGLRDESRDVRVLVYFGTWCSVCSRLVPKVLKVAEGLEGSKVQFDYYGLPQRIHDDPRAAEDDIRGVPTAIVYIGGKETARLDGRDLDAPEMALDRVLNGG